MIPEIAARLSLLLCRNLDGYATAPQLSFVCVGANKGSAVFLCFTGSTAKPSAVVKVAKYPKFSQGIHQEHVNLKRGGELWAPLGFVIVPQLIDLFEVDGCAVLVESFLDGSRFLSTVAIDGGYFHRRRITREMNFVTRWCVETATLAQQRGRALTRDYVRDLCDAFRSAFSPSPLEEGLLSYLVERASNLPLFLSPAHGDFFPGNILFRKGRIAVLDWTFLQEETAPLFDFVWFVTSRPLWAKNQAVILEDLMFPNGGCPPDGWYETLLKGCVRSICKSLGLDPSAVPTVWGLALLAACVVDRSSLGPRPGNTSETRQHFVSFAKQCLG
jgi:hypothetical protein